VTSSQTEERVCTNFPHQQPCRYLGLSLEGDKYLLLIEFEGLTGSYGPSFFSFDLFVAHKSKETKRGSVIYSTDKENEVSKIFSIFLLCV